MSHLDALQQTLAAEHAAVFLLGYLGGQTPDSLDESLRERLREAHGAHRDRRDQLEVVVRAAGEEPVAAAPSYEIDTTDDPGASTAAALRLERSCGRTYGYLVASSPSEHRRWAVLALVDSARRELDFGGATRPYPGR